MARQAMEDVSAAAFRWEPVPDEPRPDDPRRRRRVRALVAACVVGVLAIVTIAVVATVVLVHKAHEHDGGGARCYAISVRGGPSCPDFP